MQIRKDGIHNGSSPRHAKSKTRAVNKLDMAMDSRNCQGRDVFEDGENTRTRGPSIYLMSTLPQFTFLYSCDFRTKPVFQEFVLNVQMGLRSVLLQNPEAATRQSPKPLRGVFALPLSPHFSYGAGLAITDGLLIHQCAVYTRHRYGASGLVVYIVIDE